MNTLMLIMAEFETSDIPLSLVAPKYFGMEIRLASERAGKQALPVPVFRGGSQRSQWLVSAIDLASWVDEEREAARKDWKRMQSLKPQ